MLQHIVEVLQTISSLIYYLILLSFYIGKIIVALLNGILNGILSIIGSLCSFLVVFYEEFSIFFGDCRFNISSVITTCLKLIRNGYDRTIELIYIFMENMIHLYTTGELKISNAGTSFSLAFFWIFDILKKSLILLGGGVWFLITLLPNFLAYILNVLYTAILITGRLFGKLSLHLIEKILKIPTKIFDYFKDVPLQALAGLICIYIIYKKFNIVKRICNILLRKIKRHLQILYTKVHIFIRQRYYNFLLGSLWRRRRTVFNQRAVLNSSVQRTPVSSRVPTKKSRSSPNNNLLCVICKDEDKSVVLFPCKHLCLCAVCSNHLNYYQNKCPICRDIIINKINVYI